MEIFGRTHRRPRTRTGAICAVVASNEIVLRPAARRASPMLPCRCTKRLVARILHARKQGADTAAGMKAGAMTKCSICGIKSGDVYNVDGHVVCETCLMQGRLEELPDMASAGAREETCVPGEPIVCSWWNREIPPSLVHAAEP
jgi:hypothetical protein